MKRIPSFCRQSAAVRRRGAGRHCRKQAAHHHHDLDLLQRRSAECQPQLVEQFNSTVGKEKEDPVESSSQGSVNDLETSVLAAAEGKGGCREAAQHRLLLRRHCLYAGQMGLLLT